jgi:hypothetical protein
VQFGLQFKGMEGEAKATGPTQVSPPLPAAEQNQAEPDEPEPPEETAEKPAAPAEVVSLDSFRKK